MEGNPIPFERGGVLWEHSACILVYICECCYPGNQVFQKRDFYFWQIYADYSVYADTITRRSIG